MAAIPPELLDTVGAENGGQIALVIGAGCSFEPPTSMPLARQLATESHRKLILSGLLAEGDCQPPDDLAMLATCVFNKTNSQDALVRQFPLDRMRSARGNEGYLHLAALMLEGVISHTLSLNFDLAPENAARELGQALHVVDLPGAAIPMTRTVVHLHGSANGPSDSLILRVESLNQEWKNRWQQVVAQQVLAAPIVLFAGLGSAAPVLSETVTMIADALGNNKTFYQADVVDHDKNAFAEQLGVARDHYIKGAWSEVMRALGGRLRDEHVHQLREYGAQLLGDNQVEQSAIDSFRRVADRLGGISLPALGLLRARLELDETSRYVSHSNAADGWLTQPIAALGILEDLGQVVVAPAENGMWRIETGAKARTTIMLASGMGIRRRTALEGRLRRECEDVAMRAFAPPDIVILAGMKPEYAPFAEQAPPVDIVEGEVDEDLVTGNIETMFIDADAPDFAQKIEAWLNAH